MTDTFTSTDLDLLMSIDPLDLTVENLDSVIAYHRNLRAMREAGKGKAARAKAQPTQKLDIMALMGTIVKAAPTGGQIIKRRG